MTTITTENQLICEKSYIPEHEVLSFLVKPTDYLIDYYIHLKDNELSPKPEQDKQLKRLMICMAVHLSIRPMGETVAWTLHLHAEEPYSLFVTGNAELSYLVGHVIADNIRHTDVNILHSQVVSRSNESSRSTIQSTSSNVSDVVETLYRDSEQRPLRIAFLENSDDAVAITSLPSYDSEWFESADLSKLAEQLPKALATYRYSFSCDCSSEKLLP